MKKTPNSNPLNGEISASIWYRYFVSARSKPAKNAPNVSDKPIPKLKFW